MSKLRLIANTNTADKILNKDLAEKIKNYIQNGNIAFSCEDGEQVVGLFGFSPEHDNSAALQIEFLNATDNTDALNTACEWAFENHGFNKIRVALASARIENWANDLMPAGFQQAGYLKKEVTIDNELSDIGLYEMLHPQFRNEPKTAEEDTFIELKGNPKPNLSIAKKPTSPDDDPYDDDYYTLPEGDEGATFVDEFGKTRNVMKEIKEMHKPKHRPVKTPEEEAGMFRRESNKRSISDRSGQYVRQDLQGNIVN